MSKRIYLIGATVIIVAIIFILKTSSNNKPGPQKPPEPVTVAIAPVEDSGVSGIASLVEQNGAVKITISLMRGTFGNPEIIYLQDGPCNFPLSEVIQVLGVAASGFIETQIQDITLNEIISKAPLSIGVYIENLEGETLIACGEIRELEEEIPNESQSS